MKSNIFDHSPWLVPEERYCQVSDHQTIESLLQSAKESHTFLTICDKNLNIHFKSVMIKINRKSFQIDKPIEWDQESRSFQIFFKDDTACWNMIKTKLLHEGLYVLNASKPETIYTLNNRRNLRVDTLGETTTSFITSYTNMTDLQVLNLSKSGMLVCGIPNDKCLPINSFINDISISLPEKYFQTNSTRVDKGRVVRTFNFKNSRRTCHAITFINDGKPAPPELGYISQREHHDPLRLY